MSRRYGKNGEVPVLKNFDPDVELALWDQHRQEEVQELEHFFAESLELEDEFDDWQEMRANEDIEQLLAEERAMFSDPRPLLELSHHAKHQLRGICEVCEQEVHVFLNPNLVIIADFHHVESENGDGVTVCEGRCQPVVGTIFSELPRGRCRGECDTYHPLKLPEHSNKQPTLQAHQFCGNLCSGSEQPPI